MYIIDCTTSIKHQRLWGYEVEKKLHQVVRGGGRMNTAALNGSVTVIGPLKQLERCSWTKRQLMISKQVAARLFSRYPAEQVPFRKQDSGGYCFSWPDALWPLKWLRERCRPEEEWRQVHYLGAGKRGGGLKFYLHKNKEAAPLLMTANTFLVSQFHPPLFDYCKVKDIG
jgi:hypothetical protein